MLIGDYYSEMRYYYYPTLEGFGIFTSKAFQIDKDCHMCIAEHKSRVSKKHGFFKRPLPL